MTRWNEKACLTLGEKVNAQVKLVSPLSDSIYNITKLKNYIKERRIFYERKQK